MRYYTQREFRKIFMRKFLLLLVILIGTIASAATSETTLPNGLRVIVKEDHRFPVAIFEVWYRVGGSYETEGSTGISHVVEHMMFEGTSQYPEDQFSKLITQHGGELNASTTDDYTVYYEKLAAKHLELSFMLEADRMRFATMSDKAFAKEIQVVMEERRMRYDDQPPMLTYERLRAAAFLSEPYHHMTIGWMGDLENLTADQVRNWYHQWYTPNNATLVIVGDVQPQDMFALAKHYFGNIAATPLPIVKPIIEQTLISERTIKVALPAQVPTLFLAYNTPTMKTATVAWEPYALDMLATILAGMDSSRLNSALVRGQELAAGVGADYNAVGRASHLLVITAIPNPHKAVAQLTAAINAEIKKLQTTPLTGNELITLKNQFMANKVYAQDSIETQANLLGNLASVGLPINVADDYLAHINAITAEEIQEVAKKYLQKNRLTVAILTPLPMNQTDLQRQQAAARANANGALR
jgi:zinc protease